MAPPVHLVFPDGRAFALVLAADTLAAVDSHLQVTGRHPLADERSRRRLADLVDRHLRRDLDLPPGSRRRA